MELTSVNPEGQAQESSLLFKIIMVGGPKVGKSNLMYKLVYNAFDLGSIINVGVEFGCVVVPHKQKHYKIQLWDSEEATKLSSIYDGFHKNAIGMFRVKQALF
jgi:GTPase SAR1 family protein